MGLIEIEFPCGLEIRSDAFGCFMSDDDLDLLYEKGCPIHGKKCHK